MTFTEAAVEILRRAGKPLHFKQIAADAITAGLLSHVGQTPEATMGARLLAMARREHDKAVVATETGVFALLEWGLATAAPLLETPAEPASEEPLYRSRERHPPIRSEFTPGGGRREDRRRREDDDESRQRRRYAPPADVAHAWLRDRGSSPRTLEELAQGLRAKDKIAEALERDLPSFEKALREENRRRQDAGRPLLFEFLEDGRIKPLELPREAPQGRRPEREGGTERRERAEPFRVPPLVEEQRRQAMRSVRRRLSSLELGSLERVAVALLEAQGYRELNMARRSAKEGPLYLARRKWGSGELRYAVRVLRPGAELGRAEVQDLRRDLSHYSAQLGIVFAVSDCTRDAKGEANSPSAAPVLLYGAEAFAEALVEAGLGVNKRTIEWLEFDDAFFTSVGANELPAELAELPPAAEPADEPPPSAPVSDASGSASPRDERGRRGRDRRRDRERRRDEPQPPKSEGPAVEPAEGVVAVAAAEPGSSETPAPEAPPVQAPTPVETDGPAHVDAPPSEP